ncbi:MAG: D-arabinose 5-phosphate isomerase [Bacteroidetes bacterium GWA2_32_17]|nr:MAG: D-arabinose 5-phosphate isomerase [Bacteroidetes bacterium GWA2_32_17]
METNTNIKELAIKTIEAESEAIKKIALLIDDDFEKVVELIFSGKGRVIATGIGKSAIIAQKLVATLNSTGTPAVFMHAADAIHGDLGIILTDDVVICISKSGDTPEIKVLIPIINNRGNKIVAIVSNANSFLSRNADFVLKATVDEEACPNNLAPTSSTTAQLVLCDALAVCLLYKHGFTKEDFAKFHPGGTLGKKLYMRVKDIYKYENPPKVKLNDGLKSIIFEISSKRMGAAVVVDEKDNVLGIITDGDLRRMLEKPFDFNNVTAKDIMTKSPKYVSVDEMAINAFYLMEKHKITQLIVCKDNKYKGILHIHDILHEGIV